MLSRENLYNDLHSIFTNSTGNLPEYDWADLLLQLNADVVGGQNARSILISSDVLTFAYNQGGSIPSPSSATITASAYNTELTPYYEFQVDGITVQNTTTNTYIYTPQVSFSLMPDIITVKLREGSNSGSVLAQGQLLIQGTQALSGAMTISLTNVACVLPVSNPGGVVTYTGSGTEIRVWEGNNQLTVDNNGGPTWGSSTFRIGTPTGTNITCGSITQTLGADHATIGDMSSITALTASIAYPIIVTNSAGITTTYTRLQIFSESLQGAQGAPGSPGTDGVTPIVANVSNETCNLPSDVSGNVSSYTGSGTLIQVYAGTTQLQFTTGTATAGQFSCGTPTQNPSSILTVGTRSVSGLNCVVADHSAMTAGTDSVVISYPLTIKHPNGSTISMTVNQSIAKSKQGYTSQYVSISGDQVFKYPSSGAITPAPTSIILTANLYGGLSTYSWQYFRTSDSSWQNLSGTQSAQTYTLTYNQAEWTTATLRIRCLSGSYYDTISIMKLYDGTNNITPLLTNENFSFPASSAGVVSSYTGSGTDIHVYQGVTELAYDGVGTSNGTWKISSTTPTNITVGSLTDMGLYVRVGIQSGVSSGVDTSSIVYNISGTDSYGSSFSFAKTQTFTKSKAGVDGLPGADGVDGAAGSNARAVNLTATALAFSYNTAGSSPSPSNSTVTATAFNTVGTVYYEFFKNDVSVQGPNTTNTYVYAPQSSWASMPDKLEVQIREGATTNPILARNQITIVGLKAGQSSITITSTNSAHTIPTDAAGTPGSGNYVGSGTTFQVWEGATQLVIDNTSPYANSSFRVSVGTAVGIMASASITQVDGNNYYTIGDHSNMTADTATIPFTITVVNGAGVTTTYSTTQTFSKSKAGTDSTSYWIVSPVQVIQKSSTGVLNPTSVTVNAQSKTGAAGVVAYSGYWYTYESLDGINKGTGTAISNNSIATRNPTSNGYWLKFELYSDSGRTLLLDQITIPVVSDGSPGTAATTGQLTNDNCSIPTDASGTIYTLPGPAVTSIIMYNGTTQDAVANWTYSATPSNCTGSFGSGSAANQYSLATITSDSGYVDIIATRVSPATVITKRFLWNKNKQGTSGVWPSSTSLIGYWSFNTSIDWPDKASTTSYLQGTSLTDSWSGWAVSGSGTISITNGNLIFSHPSGGGVAGLSITPTSSKKLRFRVRVSSGTPTSSILRSDFRKVSDGTFNTSISKTITIDGTWNIIDMICPTDSCNPNFYLGTYNDTEVYSLEVDWYYIGDGVYSTPAFDDSLNGNNGVIQGATPSFGVSGKAFYFNGITDRIVTPTLSFPSTGHTLALWVNLASYTSGNFNIAFGPNSAFPYIGFYDGYARYSWRDASGSQQVLSSSTRMSLSTWIHLCGTHDGTTATLYVNGIQTAQTALSLHAESNNYYIGSFGDTLYLNGTIDEPRTYTRALSSSEVYGLYSMKALSPTTPNPTISISGDQVFKYSSLRTVSPTSIVLTAILGGGLTTYSWQYFNTSTLAWTNLSGTQNAQIYTLTYNQLEWGTAQSLQVRCASGAYSDDMTIIKVNDGAGAVSVLISNESTLVPADYTGNVTDYSGTGTTISVYEGSTPLQFTTGIATAGQFSCGTPVQAPLAVLTIPAASISGYNCVFANYSAMSLVQDSVIITFNLTIVKSDGTTVTTSVTETVTKAMPGTSGTWPSNTGLAAYWSLDNVPDYPDGTATYSKNSWTTGNLDNWTGTLEAPYISNGNLTWRKTLANQYLYKTNFGTINGQTCRMRYRVTENGGGATSLFIGVAEAGNLYQNLVSSFTTGIWTTYDFTINSDHTYTQIYITPNSYASAGPYTIEFDWFYVGNGSFTSTINDDSGNGNICSLNGATTVPGISGKALYFDGINDYFQTTTSNFTVTSDFTISFWASQGSAVTGRVLFRFGGGFQVDGVYAQSGANPNIYGIIWNRAGSYESNGSFTLTSSLQMYTITYQYSTKTYTIYTNGLISQGPIVLANQIVLPTSLLIWGAHYSGNYFFSGTIDEPRVYTRILTADEIWGLYSMKAASGSSGASGNFQTEVTVYYQGLTTPTAPTTGTGTYLFSTGSIIVPTGNVTWQASMPPSSPYPTWQTTATFSSSNPNLQVAPISIWATPIRVAQNASRKHVIV